MILLLVCVPASAGDIYVWRDHAGVSHYTTDLGNVPEEFRGDATTVAKEWKRAEPAPEPVAAAAAAPAGVTAEAPIPATTSRELYEAAYLAGVRAAQEQQAASAGDTTNVVQSVQVQPQPAAPNAIVTDRIVPVPVIVDRRPRVHSDRRDDDRIRDDFPPAQRAPFLQGPAGPPPVSDR